MRFQQIILTLTMPLMLISCATYPTAESVKNMSLEQSQKLVKTGLMDRCTWGYKETRVTNDCIKSTNVVVTSRKVLVKDIRGMESIYLLDELPQISKSGAALALGGEYVFLFKNAFHGDDVVEALYVLQQHAIKLKEEREADDGTLVAQLSEHRKKIIAKEPLPEETKKYKIQAESAIQDKQFDEAADLYTRGLKIAPWWAVGRFNLALVLSETKDYALAVQSMKNYLLLMPDAPNAKAAQEKIYQWERLISK